MMASLGKKILSAFVEVTPPPPQPAANKDNGGAAEEPASSATGTGSYTEAGGSAGAGSATGGPAGARGKNEMTARADSRFADYFDNLFREANIPGPDYYEFSRMILAMQTLPDEASRFAAAYAGLQVQGLDKGMLLSTAAAYLQVLETDANQFHSTVDAALQEKVHARTAESEEKRARIQTLTKEIGELQGQVHALQAEIAENEEKISSRNGAYIAESAERRARIEADIAKIKNYLR